LDTVDTPFASVAETRTGGHGARVHDRTDLTVGIGGLGDGSAAAINRQPPA
jgi:hypothetical protein